MVDIFYFFFFFVDCINRTGFGEIKCEDFSYIGHLFEGKPHGKGKTERSGHLVFEG